MIIYGRRMTAEEVKMLQNGSLVTIRCDQRVTNRKFGTRCYRVSTRNGLKLLIHIDPPYELKTIHERPGQYYCREEDKKYKLRKEA